MYIEVHFQRNTSQSINTEASVFRLKRNREDLDPSDYTANLSLYFDQSRSVSNLTLGGLRNVLTGLNGGTKQILMLKPSSYEPALNHLVYHNHYLNMGNM